jgi:hypothetical protein
VFKRIKHSHNWEKSLLYWEEMGVPMKLVFGQIPFPDQAHIRENARGIQADGGELEDVAVLAAAYLFDALSAAQQDIVRAKVFEWTANKKLHPVSVKVAKERFD